jgi:hypothetical protein
MPLFHDKAVEMEHKTPIAVTEPAQAIQETALPDVEAAVRLLSDKQLRTRKGAMVWLWTALVLPLIWVALNGEVGSTIGSLFFLATAFTLHRLTADLDRTRVVLQTNLDKPWIGALVDALEWPNRRIRAIARWYLVRLLPSVTEADAALLDDAQRAGLYAYLSPLRAVQNPPLARAILKALEQIGDRAAVPHVARLARLTAPVFRLCHLRNAALVCLPLLERRVLQQRLAPSMAEAQTPQSVARETPIAPEQKPMEAHVEEELQKIEAASRKAQPGMRLGFLLASWWIIVPYTAFQAVEGFQHRNWLQALVFGCLAVGATQLHRLTLTSKHRAKARYLAGLNSVQAVGPLAEALDWPDMHSRRIAIEALTQLLPRLHATDAALLNPAQRAALYRTLTMTNAGAHSKFLVALLKALEQVGDQAAIPSVENLLKSQPVTSQQKKVHEAARDCLPYLQEQARQDQYSQTLLRAASGPTIPTETLLRPVSSPQCVETAYLLRADTTEDRGAI